MLHNAMTQKHNYLTQGYYKAKTLVYNIPNTMVYNIANHTMLNNITKRLKRNSNILHHTHNVDNYRCTIIPDRCPRHSY